DDNRINKEKAFMRGWDKCKDEEGYVSKEQLEKTLAELYPKHFPDVFACENYFNQHSTRFVLSSNGKYRMSL
ncbi:MAG: hypothetical protein ACRD9Q_04040, partial [Nitrososphaeraceae archaeon]